MIRCWALGALTLTAPITGSGSVAGQEFEAIFEVRQSVIFGDDVEGTPLGFSGELRRWTTHRVGFGVEVGFLWSATRTRTQVIPLRDGEFRDVRRETDRSLWHLGIVAVRRIRTTGTHGPYVSLGVGAYVLQENVVSVGFDPTGVPVRFSDTAPHPGVALGAGWDRLVGTDVVSAGLEGRVHAMAALGNSGFTTVLSVAVRVRGGWGDR